MKKIIVLTLVALLAVPFFSATATAGKKKPKQTVEGSVAAAVRHPDGCYSGMHRRIQAFTRGANGVIGYDFDVDKKTWNKKFVLELTGGVGTVDLDMTYYLGERTKPEDIVADPGNASVPPNVGYETREEGGEAGTVPKGAIFAIVCIYESENGAGALADFTYTAG